MGIPWQSILAGLGQGAAGLGEDINRRKERDLMLSREDEIRRMANERQQAQDALNLLRTVQPMGGQVLPEGADPISELAKRSESNRLVSGGAIPNSALGIPDESVPDAFGTPTIQKVGQANVLFDPSKSQDAMQERRFLTQQARTDARARQAQEAVAAREEAGRQAGALQQTKAAKGYYEALKGLNAKHPLVVKPFDPEVASSYKDALDFEQAKQLKATGGSEADKVIVPVQMPDGTTKYVSRAQALGMSPLATTRDSRPSEGERQAAGLMPEIEDAHAKLDAVTPDLLTKFTANVPLIGNYIKTDTGRQFEQIGRQFINNTILAKTGKAANRDEVTRYYGELIPEPGDDAVTLANKKNARDLFIKGAYIMAGRAANEIPKPGGGTTTPKGGGDPEFDALMAKYKKRP